MSQVIILFLRLGMLKKNPQNTDLEHSARLQTGLSALISRLDEKNLNSRIKRLESKIAATVGQSLLLHTTSKIHSFSHSQLHLRL